MSQNLHHVYNVHLSCSFKSPVFERAPRSTTQRQRFQTSTVTFKQLLLALKVPQIDLNVFFLSHISS